jgi:plastocyanin
MSKNLPLVVVVCIVVLGLLGAILFQKASDNRPLSVGTATTTESQLDEVDTMIGTDVQSTTTTAETPTSPTQASDPKQNYEGVHIMPDGTVMAGDGNPIPKAIVLANGTIRLNDGTVITPVLDMRSGSGAASENKPEHKVIDVIGTDFEYDIKQIKVKKGDTVTIYFKSNEGFHDWVVDEFNAATDRVTEKDGVTSVTFVADKVGTFQYYCSVMSHRQMGMIGYLVVEEN